MGAWLLAAMVLVNCYSGTVVSYLTAPIMMPSINTLDDLAASEDVGILMVDNNVMGQQIMVLRFEKMRSFFYCMILFIFIGSSIRGIKDSG
jgi:hypothetical protein